MRNITVSVDDGVYHRARLFAAEYDTSVSALVAGYLENLPVLMRRMQEANAAQAAKSNANTSTEKTSA
ncbi:MAG: hypothetical protein ABSG51_09995 [Terracidiphilus sp.]|jgi:hypothetical protein